MGWAARVGWAVLGLGVVGCDGGARRGSVHAAARPAAVALAGSCTVDGVRIEVEEGVLGGFTGESPCSYSGRFVSVWRATYEERWGAVALESWTVRIRARGAGGRARARRAYLVSRAAHRAEPAPLRAPAPRAAPRGAGEASSDHHGWCADFVPWELERHIQDERAQLGCGV